MNLLALEKYQEEYFIIRNNINEINTICISVEINVIENYICRLSPPLFQTVIFELDKIKYMCKHIMNILLYYEPIDDIPLDITTYYKQLTYSIENFAYKIENGHYNPNSCASYVNTIDSEKSLNGLKAYIDEQLEIAKSKNVTPMSKEKLTKRFELTESARYFYTNDKEEANVFTFKIESVGVIPPLIIFHRAINIIKEKINNFISNLISKNENAVKINVSDKFSGGYDIIVNDEDDTLGTIIQSHLAILYADFSLTKEQRKLQFIGYKKPHPLEKKIMFSIQGQNDNLDELINDIIKVGCNEIIKMLNKIQNELEGTSQFVNELKMIS